MTVLTPFMTRYGAGPWCGVEVQAPGMLHAAQQFAASFAPGGAFWETLGVFGTATTERYDTAARAVFVTVTALVVIGFGSWSGFIGAIGGRTRRAAARALGGLNLFFTGTASAEDALEAQLRSTYETLANTWDERGPPRAGDPPRDDDEDSFQACLAIAVALGATPSELMDGRSAFGGERLREAATNARGGGVALSPADVMGLNLSVTRERARVDEPTFNPDTAWVEHDAERGWVPQAQLVGFMERFLSANEVAEAISNLPAPSAELPVGARAKYMQLRSLLQLAAITAAKLNELRRGPAMAPSTQAALQQAFQETMQTYRDMRINSLLAAEDLSVAFATNVGYALMPAQGAAPGGQGGGRRRRRTRRSKPRSRARRKGNKRKTRVGKRRRTRKH